jgi:hypothetical protein
MLDSGNHRYLVIAKFSTTGDVTPFECRLTAGGVTDDVRVADQGSQTLLLIVPAPPADVEARLSCADSNPLRHTNLVHRTIMALRVST